MKHKYKNEIPVARQRESFFDSEKLRRLNRGEIYSQMKHKTKIFSNDYSKRLIAHESYHLFYSSELFQIVLDHRISLYNNYPDDYHLKDQGDNQQMWKGLLPLFSLREWKADVLRIHSGGMQAVTCSFAWMPLFLIIPFFRGIQQVVFFLFNWIHGLICLPYYDNLTPPWTINREEAGRLQSYLGILYEGLKILEKDHGSLEFCDGIRIVQDDMHGVQVKMVPALEMRDLFQKAGQLQEKQYSNISEIERKRLQKVLPKSKQN